jgi:uncharacterized Zn finger protein (UPF0148 family)
MEGIIMEADGVLYKINHCKECGMLFFVKPGSLNQFCDTCGEKKILEIKELFSTRRKVNALKGGLTKKHPRFSSQDRIISDQVEAVDSTSMK